MGWLNNLFGGKVLLTENNRDIIYKLFGSLNANQMGTSDRALLEEGYESNVDVYAVIKKIVDTYKAVPVIVEKRTSKGWELLEDSSIHDLMANPNVGKGYTWDDIEEMIMIYLLCNGNSYMIGENGFSSMIQEVDILPAPSIEIVSGNDFFMPNARYDFTLNTQTRSYSQDEIEHIRLFNPSYSTVSESLKGLSPIAIASRVVQVGNDRWDADANLLQNRGAIGLITDKSNRPMTGEEAAKVQSSFDSQTTGTRNFGKVKVTNKDLSYIQMAMSSTDLQILEKGVVNLRAIYNVFGLDSSLFNDPANKTFNNRQEAEKALYTNAIMPIANKISQKHTQFLCKNHYPDGSVRMRKDFDEVEALQRDKKMEAEKDKIVMDGINVVLTMPISADAKRILLIEQYELSEELAAVMTTTPPPAI